MRQSLTTVTVLISVAGLAAAQSTRHVAQTLPEGAGVLVERAALAPVQNDATPRAGVLWTYNDPVSIPQSVALGDDGDDSWVAHWLNDKRVSHFDTTGPGTPDFAHSLTAENPDAIGVEAARDRSLMAAIYWRFGVPVAVRAFSEANGATPLWTYNFGASFTNSGQHAVDVNDDGSRIAACAYDGANTKLVLLDDTGTEIGSAAVAGYCSGVELSGDGSRILVTAGATARLYAAATMTEIYSLAASGSGGFHRISRDGSAIAAGGFNIRAAREIAGVWTVVYNGTGSSQWFGWGVALSGDGQTLFTVAHNYIQGYLPNEHRLIDLSTGSQIDSWTYTGVGSLQNSVVGAEANDDGTIFVAASWGDQGNTQPEVRIFDRDLTMIGSVDTFGSPFDVDMSPDGRYVLVGSKGAHANNMGSGGNTYLYENDVNTCAIDLNNDGILDFFDVQLFLNLFSSGDLAADLTGDGNLDFFDVQLFLNLFSAGCP
ncbi:MAG: hypothetical protein DYG94_03010 [Leptolyngbya sp. PLA3]|nr:MAG: hypothetical protein EDM82_11290 [Cyanobacteria bacterium CYA]MCE7967699.1 hypothetical protein [Leptolyngbya sp. PL-A3]